MTQTQLTPYQYSASQAFLFDCFKVLSKNDENFCL